MAMINPEGWFHDVLHYGEIHNFKCERSATIASLVSANWAHYESRGTKKLVLLTTLSILIQLFWMSVLLMASIIWPAMIMRLTWIVCAASGIRLLVNKSTLIYFVYLFSMSIFVFRVILYFMLSWKWIRSNVK